MEARDEQEVQNHGHDKPHANRHGICARSTDAVGIGLTFAAARLVEAADARGNSLRVESSGMMCGPADADVTFTGGSELNQLPTTNGWTFGGDINSLANPGYEHYAVGKVYLLTATAVQPKTWGAIKALYENAR